jgi:hypothetical protein
MICLFMNDVQLLDDVPEDRQEIGKENESLGISELSTVTRAKVAAKIIDTHSAPLSEPTVSVSGTAARPQRHATKAAPKAAPKASVPSPSIAAPKSLQVSVTAKNASSSSKEFSPVHASRQSQAHFVEVLEGPMVAATKPLLATSLIADESDVLSTLEETFETASNSLNSTAMNTSVESLESAVSDKSDLKVQQAGKQTAKVAPAPAKRKGKAAPKAQPRASGQEGKVSEAQEATTDAKRR